MNASTISTPVRRRVVLVVATVMLLDQLTKGLAGLLPQQQATGIFLPLRNPQFLLGLGGSSAVLTMLAAMAGIVLFGGVAYRSAVRGRLPAAIPGLLIGGALSNLVDRLLFGSVRDFIATPLIVVNVADLAVAAGLIGLALASAVRHYLAASTAPPTAQQ
jgi:lipoprotein signal peptidase